MTMLYPNPCKKVCYKGMHCHYNNITFSLCSFLYSFELANVYLSTIFLNTEERCGSVEDSTR